MTDTDKLDIVNYALEFLADLWSRFFYPVSIDKEIRTKNGKRVRIQVREVKE